MKKIVRLPKLSKSHHISTPNCSQEQSDQFQRMNSALYLPMLIRYSIDYGGYLNNAVDALLKKTQSVEGHLQVIERRERYLLRRIDGL